MKLLRIHHAQIGVPPGALDQARAFYCGLLGMREIEKPEILRKEGRPGFWLELGDAQIHVSCEDGVDRSATKSHVAYEVESLDDAKRTLAAAGVAYTDGRTIPGYVRGDFRDPFGNRIEILARSP